jgi:hypothetical protein
MLNIPGHKGNANQNQVKIPQKRNIKAERHLCPHTQEKKLTLANSSLIPNFIPRRAHPLMEWELP